VTKKPMEYFDTKALADRTKDAYSFNFYGPEQWTKLIEWLAAYRFSEKDVEEILRSKATRWATDENGVGTARAFISWFNEPRNKVQVVEILREADVACSEGNVSLLATVVDEGTRPVSEPNQPGFRIWNFERGAYWKPGQNGYTLRKRSAGVYSLEEATRICNEANRFKDDTGPEEAMIPVWQTEGTT
jgi:hypothetical protein